MQREAMEYDIVVVGAGPAGLAAAIRVKQLSPETTVCVLEKGSEVGAHILSGAVVDPKAPITEENFVQRLQNVFLGEQDETLRYRESLHPDDRRQNLVEVQLAPTYMYLDSNSSYSYRNYSSSGSGLGIGAQFWMTPFLGITSSYFVTLASDMSADVSGDRKLQVDHRFFDAGPDAAQSFIVEAREKRHFLGVRRRQHQPG